MNLINSSSMFIFCEFLIILQSNFKQVNYHLETCYIYVVMLGPVKNADKLADKN